MIDFNTAIKISKLVKVTDQKTATQSPLKLYPDQELILKALCEHREVQVLKSRQTGVSTIVLFFLMLVLLQKKRSVAIVAQDHPTAVKMISDLSDMMSSIDVKHTKIEKKITLANGSYVDAMTAGSAAAMRGRSYSVVHCTEVAFWPDSIEAWTALSPAVNPAVGRVIFESTAAAGDNIYRRTWDDTDSKYVKIFTRFENHPNYVADPSDITDETFAFLQKEYSIKSRPHAAWWYAQFVKNGRDANRTLREYPIISDHAWTAASGRWIPIDPPVRKYTIDSKYSCVHTYTEPNQNNYYVAALDTATGAGKDNSVFVVYDTTQKEIVCSISTKTLTVADIMPIIATLIPKYNVQQFYIETNGPGHAALLFAQQHQLKPIEVWTGSRDKGSYSGMLWVREQILHNNMAADETLLDHCRSCVIKTSNNGNETFDGRKDFLLALSFIGTNEHRWTGQKIPNNQPVDPTKFYVSKFRNNNSLGRL